MDVRCFFFLVVFGVFCAAQGTNSTSGINSTTIVNSFSSQTMPLWLNSSSTELATFMSDQYNYFVTPGGNKVWVCTMSLAWNQLKREMLSNREAQFKNTTALQDKIIANFNAELFNKNQLSESSYYVSAGFGQQAVTNINFQVKQKFPNKKFIPLIYQLKDQDFISYAYLQKMLCFRKAFSVQTGLKFKNVTVEAFSATTSKQRKQLYFKYYNNQNQFLMGIQTSNPNDEILILKTTRSQMKNFRMQKVLEIIRLYEKLPKCRLKKYDNFKMPVLSFDYTRSYGQLKGLYMANQGFKDYVVSEMQQKLIFSLDKNGVKAASQAVIVMSRISMPMDQKSFFLNSDFWLILKQKNKKPYLIMSVTALKQSWSV